jgi:hypothetical protein
MHPQKHEWTFQEIREVTEHRFGMRLCLRQMEPAKSIHEGVCKLLDSILEVNHTLSVTLITSNRFTGELKPMRVPMPERCRYGGCGSANLEPRTSNREPHTKLGGWPHPLPFVRATARLHPTLPTRVCIVLHLRLAHSVENGAGSAFRCFSTT